MIDISLNCYYVINCYYVMQFYVPHRFLKELFGKHMNLWLHTCHKKEEYYLGIIRHGHPNAVQCIPQKAYQLKEEQLILIIAYQREVWLTSYKQYQRHKEQHLLMSCQRIITTW